ncbi:MAG TPA: hypothetical protein VHY84_17140 [Bryobacteraceae bacterium]|jgi:hypothetical protein|nr:hypothetical protein [Bryobacteraceae bacterium]
MISEKQLAANRRNALLSRGPTSAAGKRRCGLNNLRHGLTGHTTVLSEEERAAHDRFCAGIVACLRPEGALELQMAQSIADDHWRLNRVSAIESNMFALGQWEAPESTEADSEIDAALNSARVFLADAGKFALLSLYEQRIHRNLQKSMAEFRSLQTARIQQSANAQPKPVNTLPMRPAENGFEFANHNSASQIGCEPGPVTKYRSGPPLRSLIPTNRLPRDTPSGQGFEFANDPIRLPIAPEPVMNTAEFVRSGVAAPG